MYMNIIGKRNALGQNCARVLDQGNGQGQVIALTRARAVAMAKTKDSVKHSSGHYKILENLDYVMVGVLCRISFLNFELVIMSIKIHN